MKRDKIRALCLPTELIIQILLRLPVKSLVRCKCVSKFWFSLISDPHSAKSHFELVPTRTQRLLLQQDLVPVFRSIDLNASLHDDSASFEINLNFSYPHIIGSCRGLALSNSFRTLLVWNPCTGFRKQFSASPLESRLDDLFFTFLYGFGYDSSTDDYLVVQASRDPSSRSARVEVFSLRDDAWKEIEGIHYINSIDLPRYGSLLNGAIHWLAFREDVWMNVIVAFDLMERSFSEIPLPAVDLEEFQSFDFELRVLGDSLCLCISHLGFGWPAGIWVMKEYKVQSSWTFQTIDIPVDTYPNKSFYAICSTKCGDIVGTDGSSGLVKFNNEGQLLEYRSYADDDRRYESEVVVYTESLLSPPSNND
ncbi:hypothetical protein Fmac_013473 [Flemingia macrophylla]|uniref:F-box domain-containing protein n=1 Tax=Flemingia macrophylla TaxID=520843 RepID=A0ABD1MT88_9FABA